MVPKLLPKRIPRDLGMRRVGAQRGQPSENVSKRMTAERHAGVVGEKLLDEGVGKGAVARNWV